MLRFLCSSVAIMMAPLAAAPADVSFSQSATRVEQYDFVEVTAAVATFGAGNPFTGATLAGSFSKRGAAGIQVDGFCDAPDGSVFRIRFMPSAPGDYNYSVVYRQGDFEKAWQGTFQASASQRRGPIRVDPQYPWHFIWEGTGEHYFFNGTTAFWLMGWRDERFIRNSIQRLHDLKINRMRVLLAGATFTMYGEPAMTGENFTLFLRPWVAERPESYDNPGIDFTRFDTAYWRRYERMLGFARERDMIVSVVQDISDGHIHPDAGSDDERRYLRYAAARLGAFSNITWDLGDDLDSFRDEKWAHETGTLLEGWDPYQHLASSHPVHREHQDRVSAWFGFTSIQDWSRTQHALMLEERQIQLKTGRIIPQTNEEYGYEDHYPHWAPGMGSDSAEELRHVAWDIAMAGAYGTTGESARRGTNIWPDTGGGWINGRGDDTMVMLKGYQHMVDFFTSFEWWKTDPHDGLVNNGAYCLAKPGEIYAIYLPNGGDVTVTLEKGRYEAAWFSAFTGEWLPLPPVEGPRWKSPQAPGWLDWALLLQRQK
ncbi:MAG TPA: DUF4038 domain-containing protein [Bryobacteraceae bacterium]|jgi:hypothetical protein|nr:DUF4038 domain-containing protein [Bryobacteraceae bacterium]